MSGAIKINGTSSGSTTITAPASGGDESIELSTALAAKANTADLVSPGLALISTQDFSAVTSVSVNNCFTSTYTNYLVMINNVTVSGSNAFGFRLRSSGSDNSTSNYAHQYLQANNTTVNVSRATSQTYARCATTYTDSANDIALTLYRPAVAAETKYATGANYESASGAILETFVGEHAVASAFDGLTIYSAGSETIAGTISIFGYAKA